MFAIDVKKTATKIEKFIKTAVKKEGYKTVLVATSGGIDSAVSLTLTAYALGRKNIYPVLLPYGEINDEGAQDAWLIINSLKIPKSQVKIVDIKPFVDSIVKSDPKMDNIRVGNIMARMRMVVLYDLIKKYNSLVVGTENKSEHLLGYYTRFGDEASDIEPIQNLYKTQVYILAKYLKIPKKLLTKSPTAGLWNGQTDEGEFGFSYKVADEILYLYSEKKLSKKEIIVRGYEKKVVDRVWWWIEKGEFKDRVPYTLT